MARMCVALLRTSCIVPLYAEDAAPPRYDTAPPAGSGDSRSRRGGQIGASAILWELAQRGVRNAGRAGGRVWFKRRRNAESEGGGL
jgi:hypothetical protein